MEWVEVEIKVKNKVLFTMYVPAPNGIPLYEDTMESRGAFQILIHWFVYHKLDTKRMNEWEKHGQLTVYRPA